jgi:hypothetical protein
LVVVVCVAGAAHAQEGTIVLGGAVSCGKFIAASTGVPPGSYKQTRDGQFVDDFARYQGWLMGFVSGYNDAQSDNLTQQIKVDLAGLDLWMRNWCNKNPTKSVYEGASAFRLEMRGR